MALRVQPPLGDTPLKRSAEEPPSHATVIVLDTPDKIQKWNAIVNRMLDKLVWYGYDAYNRIAGLGSAGLQFADVDKNRVNPEVALVVKSASTTLDTLYEASESIPQLMNELFAFVPYSCVFPQTPASTHTLILPMGLQKTPGGYGFRTSPPSIENTATVRRNGQRTYAAQPGQIRKVLPRMLAEIELRHPKMVILTRFAKQRGLLWKSGGILQWESHFPGRFRLGWLSYSKLQDVHKEQQEGVGLQTHALAVAGSSKEVHQVRVEGGGEIFPEAPNSYRPGLGGVSIADTTLIAKNAAGKELLRVTHIDDIAAIERLLDVELESFLGTLLCGWT